MKRRNDRLRARLLGWVLALLAVLGQAAGAAALPECCQATLQPLGEICGIAHAPDPASPHHHEQDCAVCPFCAATATQVAILDAAPVLPAPRAALPVRLVLPPPARAPPADPYHPGDPRGPPTLT